MPGINANLSEAAYAIWSAIPKKTRRAVNSMGGPMEEGRSAWLSSVIVVHAGWVERYDKLYRQKHDLENDFHTAMETLNELQKKVNE